MKKNRHIYSVTEISEYIKNMFAQDFFLSNVSVCGEVSGISLARSGHLYFDLKDQENLIRITFFNFARRADLRALELKNGDRVVAVGRVCVYGARSAYQLNAVELSLDGEGEMYRRYMEIKAALEESGMFDPMYKKPLPRFVRKLGVVTSAGGRAIGDIRTAVMQRNPYVQVVLCPAQVQGDGAVEEIVRGIEILDSYGVDVIIVGRGGGSMEDLFCFNAVEIAQAIFACNTPVISAVGHEDDRFISDEVADHRSPTPSLAVTDAVFDIYEYDEMLDRYLDELNGAVVGRIDTATARLDNLEQLLSERSPESLLERRRRRVDEVAVRLDGRIKTVITSKNAAVEILSHRLEALSPLKRMTAGFAFVSDEKGRAVKDIGRIAVGDKLKLDMVGGTVHTRVDSITKSI